jgi:hypothetical protein
MVKRNIRQGYADNQGEQMKAEIRRVIYKLTYEEVDKTVMPRKKY